MIHIINISLLYLVAIVSYRIIFKMLGSAWYSLIMTAICMFGGYFLAMKLFYGF